MTHTVFPKIAILAAVSALSLATPARAQDADVITLNDLTCRSYLMLGGEERDLTTLFLHGYVAGQAGTTEVRISDLAVASDKVLASCIDNPEAKLLEVFSIEVK